MVCQFYSRNHLSFIKSYQRGISRFRCFDFSALQHLYSCPAANPTRRGNSTNLYPAKQIQSRTSPNEANCTRWSHWGRWRAACPSCGGAGSNYFTASEDNQRERQSAKEWRFVRYTKPYITPECKFNSLEMLIHTQQRH
jgi:hypothetical protein